jgi:outer membrane protein
MFVSRFRSLLWIAVLSLIVLTAAAPGVRAQQNGTAPSPAATAPTAPEPARPAQAQQVYMKDYATPRPSLPRIWKPYESREVPEPNLVNTGRIDSLMHDGKIYLSIDDAVALTLENNLDLYIARYNLNIADTDYLRAKSGANILGVNAGVVQNTPGGGVGGLGGTVGSGTGGTTVAPSGVATGTNGLVTSTLGIGSTLTSFDPVFTSTLQLDKNNTISTSPFSAPPIVVSLGIRRDSRIRQHARHHQQPDQPAHSAAQFQLPSALHTKSSAGLRI